MAVLSALACAKPTTNLQQKPAAEPETGVSAFSAGSRSSRAGFPSSSNLKFFLLVGYTSKSMLPILNSAIMQHLNVYSHYLL
jgi:hypothetical protein